MHHFKIPIKICLALFFLLSVQVFCATRTLNLPLPERIVQIKAPSAGDVLTLRDAILLALRMNPDVHNAELQRVVDKFALAVAHNQFEPQYTFTAQATYANGSKPAYSATPEVSILSPYGTAATVTATPTFNGSTVTSVTVTQPLLRGFGPIPTEALLYEAQLNELSARLTLKNEVMTTIVSVIQAYYVLVQGYNDLKINKLSLDDAKVVLEQTQLKIKYGKAGPAEIAQQQTQVAQQELAVETAKNTIQQDYLALLVLLGLDPDAKLKIVHGITASTVRLPSLTQSITLALANNVDYQKALISFKATQRALLVAKDDQKWQLNVTASASRDLGSNGDIGVVSTTPSSSTGFAPVTSGVIVPTGTGTTQQLMFNLSVPIDDVQRKQLIVNAKVGLEQALISLDQDKRTLISNVMSSYNSLLSQAKQIVLAQDSVTYAQQSLDVAQIKFNYGKTTSFELTTLRTNLISAQTTLISQQISYLTAVEQFYELLGITLTKWDISVNY